MYLINPISKLIYRLTFALILGLGFSEVAICQVLDSNDHIPSIADSFIAVPNGKTLFKIANGIDYFAPDTNLSHLQRFDTSYTHNLGIPGSPSFNLHYHSIVRPGFRLGFEQWNPYILNLSNIKVYNTQNPYADFYFIQGGQGLQKLDAKYAQNILPNWNFSLHYNRFFVSEGLFDHQLPSIKGISLNTWYRSPNNRYYVELTLNNNNIQFQYNGGITDIADYLNRSYAGRVGNPVNLDSARQSYSEQEHAVSQQINFGKKQRVNHDSDSVAKYIIVSKFYLKHKFQLWQNRYIYRDKGNDYYFFNITNKDTFVSFDRNKSYTYSNAVVLGILNDSLSKISFANLEAGVQYDYIKYTENAVNNTDYNLAANLSLKNKLINVNGSYYLLGYNASDYVLGANLLIVKRINLLFTTQKNRPSLLQQHLNFNRLSYSNSFSSQLHQSAALEYVITKKFPLSTKLYLNRTDNYIYFNEKGEPMQIPALNYVRLNVLGHYKYKKAHAEFDLSYQLNDQKNLIALPNFTSLISVYLQGVPLRVLALKNNAIDGRIGLDVNYTSATVGRGFSPVNAQFTVLNGGYVLGNYPYIDFFATLKVKRFFIFAKIEHINAGLIGSKYLLLDKYPMYPRTFRLGLRWIFFN